MCVYVCEWQIYFDEFFAVIRHVVFSGCCCYEYRIIYDVEGEFIWIFGGFSLDGAGVLLGELPPRCRPSGLRIKSAMTDRGLVCLIHPHPTLWIPAYAGMTVMGLQVVT